MCHFMQDGEKQQTLGGGCFIIFLFQHGDILDTQVDVVVHYQQIGKPATDRLHNNAIKTE